MPNIPVSAAASMSRLKTGAGMRLGQQQNAAMRNEALKRWVMTPASSWVWGLRYQAVMTALDVQYKDKLRRLTALCRYPGVHINTYHGMRRAMSKGKFVHRNLYRRPYIQLSGRKPKMRASMRIRGRALKRFSREFKAA